MAAYDIKNGASGPKVFVGGLAWETTQEQLKEYFNQFGTVVDAIMPRDRDTGRSRGFGFVTFTETEGADTALGATHSLDGRALNLTAATPERIDPNAVGGDTKRLYIGDLLSTTTDEEFKAAFGVFGPMEDAIIMRHPETHESRGFGFVTYETVESANKVLAEGEVRVGGAVAKITKAAPKGGKGKGKGKGYEGKGKGG
eukprot:CAMPEP_0171949280 /NCGR_PEP_ID=MMETSP0993-20121228/71619_1 /TAXON_ID=483369 /ORGANISM="non described non described, Strain CCMP2098" /LENGTH=198 /DNA_ID=CAMNT_0012593703 /DNA_START=68 /DNA_END=661 /DNA_ORIENTATION=-